MGLRHAVLHQRLHRSPLRLRGDHRVLLGGGEEHAEPSHIRHLYDCAWICTTLQDFAILHSKGTDKLAEARAVVCDSCAESCERFTTDEPLVQCAQIGRQCAKSARMVADIKNV